MTFCYQKCTDRAGRQFMEITGYEGQRKHLSVPEFIEDLPVRRIGNHAFSGRDDLESVQLPETLDTLAAYAFYNCRNLKSLRLYDGVEDYYDGVIKQCGALWEITLIQKRGSFSVMKELLADNDRMLRFILEPSGLHLTFPAYVYNFVEDVEARVLHHKIEGSGYPYRECVTRKGVDLLSYDRLFPHAQVDDFDAAVWIAMDRLMYPLELEQEAHKAYMDFLKQKMPSVLEKLIPEGRVEEIRYLASHSLMSREEKEHALSLAAKEKQTEISAVVMECGREQFRKEDSMELEDW